jgi:hypothetical protein
MNSFKDLTTELPVTLGGSNITKGTWNNSIDVTNLTGTLKQMLIATLKLK